MATQTGILTLTGKLGSISFYKSGNQLLARKAGGPSRDQILNEKQFAATRQHLKEFGNCSTTGKIVREKIASVFKESDKTCCRRLVKVLWEILKKHKSKKGKRTVWGGLKTPEGQDLLKGFRFNKNGINLRSESSERLIELTITSKQKGKRKNQKDILEFKLIYITNGVLWKDNLIVKDVMVQNSNYLNQSTTIK